MTKFRTGNGAAWLDLLATLGGRYRGRPVDALDSPVQLRAWLRENALEPTGAVTEDDLVRVRTVREALHRCATAALKEEPLNTADVRLIDDTLRTDEPLRVRRTARGFNITRPATGAEALARLARDAVQDLSGPHRAHLHPCGDDTCSGIFLDTTGRRRWCSDQLCGNRMRVRAHRARTRPS
ncbi:MAG TPA: CGNR zinc finger domain-containing protein [Jatrophihabitans sp.]|nr:CGNR zinc finger domain-containing protein [Jatrophihabitans sp.]